MKVQSYLSFNGRCEEALEFYREAVGAEVLMLMRFKDMPGPRPPEMTAPPDKVMHSSFRIGETELMASDGRCAGDVNFQGFSLSLNAADEAEAKKLFAALGDGGQVQMPLSHTFFSPCFGMVTDRFGISWMVIVMQHGQAAAAA